MNWRIRSAGNEAVNQRTGQLKKPHPYIYNVTYETEPLQSTLYRTKLHALRDVSQCHSEERKRRRISSFSCHSGSQPGIHSQSVTPCQWVPNQGPGRQIVKKRSSWGVSRRISHSQHPVIIRIFVSLRVTTNANQVLRQSLLPQRASLYSAISTLKIKRCPPNFSGQRRVRFI